ncbi:hypothetical protein [Leeuwenhoekiella sp. W20_SRS_FM14]|uniref:hypothetical protein n=1 Tax=Leeuwenhoekiella sp. W20_SRS_FM14 TaxID=3240270 RepID=UPI003F99CAEE
MTQSLKTIDLSFCKLTFAENYVISEINQGVVLNKELFKEAGSVLFDHFKDDQNYVYIAYRRADYNVNPVDYINCSDYPNMLAVAVVTNTEAKRSTATFEKAFFPKPYEIFNTLEDAIDWVKNNFENL